MQIDFPLHFNLERRTATTSVTGNIRDMIEQLLFTQPGERVNRPEFGSGLLQMVHAPNSIAMASTLEFTTQAALNQHLGNVIEVRSLEATAVDHVLTVCLKYLVRETGEMETATFTRSTS